MLIVTASDIHGQQVPPVPAWGLAEALSRDYDVILTTPATGKASHPGFAVVYYNRRNLGLLSRDSDLVLVEAPLVNDYDFFSETGKLFNADWDTIIGGSLSEPALLPLELAGSAGPGPDFKVWIPPLEKKGFSYYLGRLRFHFRAGGIRRVLSRGVAAASRKRGRRGGG